MNKPISSRLAISLISIITLIFCAYLLFNNRTNIYATYTPNLNALTVKKVTKNTCQVHTYKGEIKIKTWQIQKDGKTVLKVAEADVVKMPSDKITDFKLIDSDSTLEKRLSTASEKNPIELTLTGIAIPCSGMPLACLKYKDGVFRPYL